MDKNWFEYCKEQIRKVRTGVYGGIRSRHLPIMLRDEQDLLSSNFQKHHVVPLAVLVRNGHTTMFLAKTLLYFLYPYQDMDETGPEKVYIAIDALVYDQENNDTLKRSLG